MNSIAKTMIVENIEESAAVLFLIFNRPESTARVFNAIRAAKPPRLYVASDGPRKDRVDEQKTVEQVREIATRVDWPCRVSTLFQPENLGCKVAVSNAINWFFDNEPEGIILEDDCLPDPFFFKFCNYLLKKYRSDERIGLISGTSLCDLRAEQLVVADEDYVFTRFFSIWGWASWRRVWKDYDVSISNWPNTRDDILEIFTNKKHQENVEEIYNKLFLNKIDTWDYQLGYSLFATSRLSITPRINLIENIGFGPGATHTTTEDELSKKAKFGGGNISWPMVEPRLILPNSKYQKYIVNFTTRSIFSRLFEKFVRILKSLTK